MAPLTGVRNRLRQERGAELIEMALVLPLLLLIIMGIIDFGFMFREMNVVTNAAREGARAGILPDYGDADVQARVQQYMTAAGIGVTCPSAECVVLSPDIPESVRSNVRRFVQQRRAERPIGDARRVAATRVFLEAHGGECT
jgi:Flp pilus assembly protein TadG